MGRPQTWNSVRANFSGSSQASYAANRALAGMTNSANNIHRQIVADAAAADAKKRQVVLDGQRLDELAYQHGRQKVVDDRATTLYDQKQNDRNATLLFNKTMGTDNQSKVDFASNKIVQGMVNDATLTDEEAKWANGVHDLGNVDQATKELHAAGANKEQTQALLSKFNRGLVLGRNMNTAVNTPVLQENRVEKMRRAINAVTGAGYDVPTTLTGRMDKARAAQVSAKKASRSSLSTQMNAISKNMNAVELAKAKAQSKPTSYRTGKRGGYRGRSFLGAKTPPSDYLSVIQHKVSPGGIGWDAHTASTIFNSLLDASTPNDPISPDKAAYITGMLVDPGGLGNNFYTGDRGKSVAKAAAKKYDEVYGNNGGYANSLLAKKGSTSGFDNILAGDRRSLLALSDKLAALDKTTGEVRNDKLGLLFGKPTEPNLNGGGTSGDKTGTGTKGVPEQTKKILDNTDNTSLSTLVALKTISGGDTNNSYNGSGQDDPSLINKLQGMAGDKSTVARPGSVVKKDYKSLQEVLNEDTVTPNATTPTNISSTPISKYDMHNPFANTVPVMKVRPPKGGGYARRYNDKAREKAQEQANKTGFASYTDAAGNLVRVNPSGLMDASLDFLPGGKFVNMDKRAMEKLIEESGIVKSNKALRKVFRNVNSRDIGTKFNNSPLKDMLNVNANKSIKNEWDKIVERSAQGFLNPADRKRLRELGDTLGRAAVVKRLVSLLN